MGANTLVTKNDREVVSTGDLNQYKRALVGDIVPRNASGVPTANAGELGDATRPMRELNVTVGGLFAGMVMHFHSYDAAISNPGNGWYPCDGSIINETNYDAVHGSNSWDTFIVSSPLDGFYTPDMDGLYLIGQGPSDPAEDGSTPINTVGSNTLTPPNHNHTVGSHTHVLSGVLSSTYGGAGSLTLINDDPAPSLASSGSGSTSLNGSGFVDISPESIEVEYWIRVI